MTYLSLRNMPVELEKEIKREAKSRHLTKTAIVLEALRSFFGIGSAGKVDRNLRSFFGKMKMEDYKEFTDITRDFSSIDEGMWK